MALRALLREAAAGVVRLLGLVEVGEMAAVAGLRRAGELAAHVAGGAFHAGVLAREGEFALAVVKLGAGPGGCGVAVRALLAELAGGMVRVLRLPEIRHVAAVTRHRDARKLSSCVALGAVCRGVFSGEREARLGVIKRRALPLRRGMAARAVHGEAGCGMVRRLGALECLAMAVRAVAGRCGESPRNVTARAGRAGVGAGQFEAAQFVVELRALPLRGRVARFTLGGEVALAVVGVGGLIEVGLVAAGALGRCAGELAADVATGALRIRVGAGEGELSEGVVIKLGARPGRVAVAGLTVLGEAGGDVIGVLRFGELLGVAGEAIRGYALELAADVAGLARDVEVRASKRESCELAVVKARAAPAVHRVAGFTGQRQVGRLVVQGSCPCVVGQVAGGALRAETREFAHGGAGMTGIARGNCVRSQQGEAVLVRTEGLHGGFPTQGRVALLAVGAKLAAMKISVAILALSSDVAEHHVGVA